MFLLQVGPLIYHCIGTSPLLPKLQRDPSTMHKRSGIHNEMHRLRRCVWESVGQGTALKVVH